MNNTVHLFMLGRPAIEDMGSLTYTFCLLLTALQVGIPISAFLSDTDNEGNTAVHLAVGNRHLHVSYVCIHPSINYKTKHD